MEKFEQFTQVRVGSAWVWVGGYMGAGLHMCKWGGRVQGVGVYWCRVGVARVQVGGALVQVGGAPVHGCDEMPKSSIFGANKATNTS